MFLITYEKVRLAPCTTLSGAEMLSIAAFEQGRHAQAFPSFGSERTGAPVVAFCRISAREIRLREPVMAPDALIVQDPTLLHQVDVFQGLKPEGYVLINSTRSFDELGVGDFVRRFRRERLCNVPASEIAIMPLSTRVNRSRISGVNSIRGAVCAAAGKKNTTTGPFFSASDSLNWNCFQLDYAENGAPRM